MPRPAPSRGTTGRTTVPELSFDAEYYRRYYGDRGTRVADPESCALLADFVFAYLAYLRLPVERVLDVGCGVGLWRREVLRHRSGALYVGVEKSGYACRKYGWEQGCLTCYRPAEEFDLVICQDVFQYLDDAEAEAAIRNLPTLSRSAFYLQILTREDWEHACDRRITDGDVHLRPAAWYRRRLRRRLVACGGGIFLAKGAPAVLYELERLA
jgi:SAM-dependent methyltransferase